MVPWCYVYHSGFLIQRSNFETCCRPVRYYFQLSVSCRFLVAQVSGSRLPALSRYVQWTLVAMGHVTISLILQACHKKMPLDSSRRFELQSDRSSRLSSWQLWEHRFTFQRPDFLCVLKHSYMYNRNLFSRCCLSFPLIYWVFIQIYLGVVAFPPCLSRNRFCSKPSNVCRQTRVIGPRHAKKHRCS